MIKCVFCGEEKPPNHLYICINKPKNKSKEDIKEIFLLLKFPNLHKKDFIEDYENLMSLVDIRSKYGIDFKASLFLLKKWGIIVRTQRESASKITIKKGEKTCLERYGTKSTFSKGSISYNKRPLVLKEKYGVENVFQIKEIKNIIHSDQFFIDRFGMTRRQKKIG